MIPESMVLAKSAALFGAALTLGIGVVGASIGLGLIGMKACENLGKYPESGASIRNLALLIGTFVEAGAIYCLILAGALIYVATYVLGH